MRLVSELLRCFAPPHFAFGSDEAGGADQDSGRVNTLNLNLLESLPQKVFVKDRNSVFQACNESFARDLGIRPEEIAGKTDSDFFQRNWHNVTVLTTRR
jgi:PAS domain-containing protein